MAITTEGRPYALGAHYGNNIQDNLTLARATLPNSIPMQGDVSPAKEGPNRLWIVGAIVALIIILKYATEHEKAGMDTKLVGIGVWNFIAIGLMAMLFLVVMKTINNKYPIVGLSDVINAS